MVLHWALELKGGCASRGPGPVNGGQATGKGDGEGVRPPQPGGGAERSEGVAEREDLSRRWGEAEVVFIYTRYEGNL